MENDVYPELYALIKKEFDSKVSKNKNIQKILNNDLKGISLVEVSLLANKIGEYAANSLINNLKEDNLPDGTLYYNILKRSITDIMKEVHELVNELFYIVQSNENKKRKIGIKPLKSKFNYDRINDIINKIDHTEREELEDEGKE